MQEEREPSRTLHIDLAKDLEEGGGGRVQNQGFRVGERSLQGRKEKGAWTVGGRGKPHRRGEEPFAL